MEEESDVTELNGKHRGERCRISAEMDLSSDKIKKFKENLLRSVSNGESILSDSGLNVGPTQPRSRSASKAREALLLPDNVLAELDETKVFELKEAFLLFDLDGDGCIDHNDLRGTFVSLGENVDEQAVINMLSEAPTPLDFDAFVNLLGYKTLELDTEQTLVAALSRWDKDNSGYISEESAHARRHPSYMENIKLNLEANSISKEAINSYHGHTMVLNFETKEPTSEYNSTEAAGISLTISRIRHDLMTWGDRFTEKEADYALDEAPTIQRGGCTMIDYVRFCSQLCGLKKPNQNNKNE